MIERTSMFLKKGFDYIAKESTQVLIKFMEFPAEKITH